MIAWRQFLVTFILLLLAGQGGCGGDESRVPEPDVQTPETVESTPLEPDASASDAPVVLFLGDSLSAGYGLPEAEAFPALIQQRIDEAGLNFQVVNAGVSGDTSAGGLRRVDWLLRRPVSVLVLELGGNDGLRGVDLADTRKNLQEIIDRFRAENPDIEIVIAGMLIPPNLGPRYTEQFRKIYPELAEENDATLIPFLLEGVAGNSELMMPDGIHPTAEGHEKVAEYVWKYLEPVLKEKAEDSEEASR